MGRLGRIFGRQPKEEAEPEGCHICGKPATYHCDSCGQLMCIEHTQIGTATCTECWETRSGVRA